MILRGMPDTLLALKRERLKRGWVHFLNFKAMKKLENLNSVNFQKFASNRITDLSKICGGKKTTQKCGDNEYDTENWAT